MTAAPTRRVIYQETNWVDMSHRVSGVPRRR